MHFTQGKAVIAICGLLLALPAAGQSVQTGEDLADISGDMQLAWIGNGVSQKALDVEIMISHGILPDSSTMIGSDYDGRYLVQISKALVGFTFRGLKPVDIKLRMPFVIKQGREGKTGPFGDMTLDIGAHPIGKGAVRGRGQSELPFKLRMGRVRYRVFLFRRAFCGAPAGLSLRYNPR
jgi:hypothetical protein